MTSKPKSAVVIGAGVSGLAASYILSKQGYNVTILEKQEEAGGRLKKGKFQDGTEYETGALWVHNSDHPVAEVFKKTGGSYQSYNKEGFIMGNINYYIINPYIKIPFQQKIENILITYHQEIKDLSWNNLLDIVSSYSGKKTNYSIELGALLSGKNSCSDWLISKLYGLSTQHEDFKNNSIELLYELGIDPNIDSVIASRYYSGGREEYYLPNEGYSTVINHLMAKLSEKDIKIKYKAKVKFITEHKVVTDKESIDADLIVSAVSAFDYKEIEVKEEAEGSLNAKSLKATLEEGLYPSGRKKIVMELSDEVNIENGDEFELQSGGGYVSITTNGMSNVVYVLADAASKTGFCVNEVLYYIQEHYDLPDILLKEKAVHYEDGKSWYKQKVGFDPVPSNQNIIYTGVLTGADDSVHSSLTAVCEALTVDTEQCLKSLFTPPTSEQQEL